MRFLLTRTNMQAVAEIVSQSAKLKDTSRARLSKFVKDTLKTSIQSATYKPRIAINR